MRRLSLCLILPALILYLASSTIFAGGDPQNYAEKLARNHEALATGSMTIQVFRLRPGDDLLESIRAFSHARHLQAAVILSAVGSFTHTSIRYANQPGASEQNGHFEIVSITGTVEDGGEHLHLSVSDEKGVTTGGHLLPGCKIYTTAEIVLGELKGVRFAREIDKQGSGWDELKVYPSAKKKAAE
jgi:predicted DNA-binding protein with PD1-like motif